MGKACQNFSRCLEVQCQPGSSSAGAQHPQCHLACLLCVLEASASTSWNLKTRSFSFLFSLYFFFPPPPAPPSPSLSDLLIFMNVLPTSCKCTECVSSAERGQQRASDPLDLELHSCESPCGRWEMKSGPTQGQPVFVIAEPSPQPLFSSFELVLII